MNKERADILCVELGLFDSREQAKRAINDRIVSYQKQIVTKPSMKLPSDARLEIVGEKLKYVSRGGLKLEKAIQFFHLDLKDKIMIDIGSSTGGFTDCALKNGVRHVYAIDVGTNQLADILRSDLRVSVHEQTNFRYVTSDLFNFGIPNFATIDVSFISLKHIFKPLSSLLEKDAYFVALIKPQFEAGNDDVKKGIVHDKQVHNRVIHEVIQYAHECSMSVQGLTYSPVNHDIVNIEFLALFKNSQDDDCCIDIDEIINEAHIQFKR